MVPRKRRSAEYEWFKLELEADDTIAVIALR